MSSAPSPFSPFRWLRRILAAAIVVVLLAPVALGLAVWWVARSDDRRASDAIVVLGAAQFDGRPSSVLEARLDHALALYEQDVAPRVVTVGGSQPGDRFTEGAAGKRWLVDRGVPSGAVVAVEEGSDTLTSLAAVDRVLDRQGWRTAVIVTDPWHALRSRTMARDLGMDAVTSPTRQGPAVRTRGVQFRYIVRETLALAYYKAFGRSSEGAESGA